MISSYQQAIDYLYKALPMFQRIGPAAYNRDLGNTLQLLDVLDHPERNFKSIHVAGTNGKGSTAHMLAAVLQSAGYRTGLYTSPHLKSFTERIRVDGKEVKEQFVIDFVNKMVPALDRIKPSFFEMTVAMAFEYFALEQVDLAVVEVGLGGRLDSTNVITPEVSVITNISFDHKELLGDTLPQIAFEKAGIIKPGVPVIVSERQTEVQDVFIGKARQENAPLVFASDTWEISEGGQGQEIQRDGRRWLAPLEIDLKGFYQRKNIKGVAATIQCLRDKGFKIPDQAVSDGLCRTAHMTGLKGRWQVMGTNPLVVADTGHNEAGIHEVLEQINATPHDHLHVVFGVVKDKDISTVLSLLPKKANYYFCQAHIPRAMEAARLGELASHAGLRGEVIPEVNEALSHARAAAKPKDLIWIGGSTFVVAALNEL